MDNKIIAAILNEIATLKELAGENAFKARAFSQAARTVEMYQEDLALLAGQGEFPKIKGVGTAIEEVIKDLVANGMSAEMERLKAAIPAGLLEMLNLQGVGPKKVKAIYDELGITTVGELEYVCKENRLALLAGFGQKSQANILKAIEFSKLNQGKFLYHEALFIVDGIFTRLNGEKRIRMASLAGSLRRGKKFVNDADILVIPAKGVECDEVAGFLKSFGEVIAAGPTKVSCRIEGLQVDFRIIQEASYPAGLQYFTGSKEHNTQLRSMAKDQGFKLNECGLFKGEQPVSLSGEGDIYRTLGLDPIPPEIREGEGEIEASLKRALPHLVEAKEIRSVIHAHSSYSDGSLDIRSMAAACIMAGYSSLCLSDHSQTAAYAGGLTVERLLAQRKEIEILNLEMKPFRIFSGIESDILADGRLDYPDEVLDRLDFVIGSIHSKLTMVREEATLRLLTAVKNPYLTILGHISGRLLLSREGYPYDEDAIFDAMRKHGTVLEHNCNPHRLDPDWESLKKAGRMGIRISLGPDAHDSDGLADIAFGVIMARKAWLSGKDILNTMEAEELNEYFKSRKKRKGH